MYKTTVVLLFLAASALSFAQPATGLKIGTNYTFYKDNEVINYSPEMAYQFGYAWRINLKENWAISLESMFTKKSANVEAIGVHAEFNINEKRNAYYFSAPVGINYCYKQCYLGVGYEFGINTQTGTLPANDYDHALFLQVGYSIRYFDVVLKYASSLSTESRGQLGGGYQHQYYDGNSTEYYPGGTIYTASYPTSRAQTIQLSVIFNFGKKAE